MTALRQNILPLLALVACLAGCHGSEPRSFEDFMDDRIAREGVLARCDADGFDATSDLECANARRAAAVVGLKEEHDLRLKLEQESQRKLDELRAQMARDKAASDAAVADAEAAAAAAYEARWHRLQDRIGDVAREVGEQELQDESAQAAAIEAPDSDPEQLAQQ